MFAAGITDLDLVVIDKAGGTVLDSAATSANSSEC
jgi:hypothetical protein